jgi:hypothetical protein
MRWKLGMTGMIHKLWIAMETVVSHPPSFLIKLIPRKNIIIYEELGLELDTEVGEIPLKGGMGVKVLHRREVCPIVNDMRESLEGVGCIVKDVRDNFSMVVVGLGEANLPVDFVVETRQGTRLISLIVDSTSKDRSNF